MEFFYINNYRDKKKHKNSYAKLFIELFKFVSDK